eukprot:543887-Prorocentrum_minimum.AAC.1
MPVPPPPQPPPGQTPPPLPSPLSAPPPPRPSSPRPPTVVSPPRTGRPPPIPPRGPPKPLEGCGRRTSWIPGSPSGSSGYLSSGTASGMPPFGLVWRWRGLFPLQVPWHLQEWAPRPPHCGPARPPAAPQTSEHDCPVPPLG